MRSSVRHPLAATSCTSPSSTTQRSATAKYRMRSEEHTSELQSHLNLVCRLLLEKKKVSQADVPQSPVELRAPSRSRARVSFSLRWKKPNVLRQKRDKSPGFST